MTNDIEKSKSESDFNQDKFENDLNALTSDALNLRESLKHLKDSVGISEDERKAQAESLKLEADEINKRSNDLQSRIDEEGNNQEQDFQSLSNILDEVGGLYTSILNPTKPQPVTETIQETQEEKGFFGRAGDWIGEQWRATTFENLKKEPIKTSFRAIGFGVTGVGAALLIGKGIKKLRNRVKERKEKKKAKQEATKEKKKFWDRRYGKALKWTGIGTAAFYVSRGLITGDWSVFGWNPFSTSRNAGGGGNESFRERNDAPSTIPGANIERSEKSYEKLSAEDKQIYELSANAVNEYQSNIMGDINGSQEVEDLMGDSEFDKDKIGLIPFMLSNRYNSLNKMLSETSIYYEILGTEGHIIWDKLKDLGLDKLKSLLMPLVGHIDGLTLNLLNLDDGLDKFIERLKGVEGLEEILRTVFRKSITVMSYYQSRKGALEMKLAEQELKKSNPDFVNLSEEDKIEEISDHLQDDERYKQYIEPEVSKFMNLNVKNATIYLQEKGLLDGELDPAMKLAMEKVDKKRRKLLNIDDEDDTSILEDMKGELNNGKLSEKAEKKLKDLCEDFEEDIFTVGKQSWYTKYFPLMQMFDGGENLMDKIQNCGDYENIANKYKEQVDSILKKAEDGTLEESDLDLLEETINDYYRFQKSLISSEINIGKAVDENGNIVFRRGRSISVGRQNIRSGLQIVTGLKEGSNREGVGLAAGGVLAIDALTFGIAGNKVLGFSPFRVLNQKVVFPVVKGGLRLTGKGIERLTGNTIRANLPSRMSATYYNKDTFRIAVGRGEISLEKAAKIAKRKGFTFGSTISGNGKLVETPEHVIQYLFSNTTEQEAKRIASIVEKYGDNPRIYRELFPESYKNVVGKRRKPKELLHANRGNVIFDLDKSVLERLEKVAAKIDGMQAGTGKTVMQSMMRSARGLDQVEGLVKTGVGDDMVRFLEGGKFMKAEEYGKYLARYASKVDPNDMRAFERFIIEAKNAGKTGSNNGLFVRNAMKNFSKIKERGFATDKIDDLLLSGNKRTKLAEKTKANCTKMVSRLREMASNSKFKPFRKSLLNQAKAVESCGKTITPKGMEQISKNMGAFSKETAFAKLTTEGMQELSRLSNLLKNADNAKDIAKALRGADTLDNVKNILSQYGIRGDKINDAVLLKIAKTKNIKKIKDIVDYGAEFKAIQGVKKLLANPAVKQVGRIGGRALIVLDFALVGYTFYSGYTEAQRVKEFNLERGERKEGQAYFELGAGGVGAIAGACMLIPGAGWIAGGVLLASMGVMEVGNKYYKDIEKFKQNQKDFLQKGIAATKQELTSVDSRDQGLSRTWIDSLSILSNNCVNTVGTFNPVSYALGKLGESSVNKKKEGVLKTKEEALMALIRMEELQKNPLAGASLDDPDVFKDPELVEMVRAAKQQLEEAAEKRFNYFKINYIDQNKPLVEKSDFEGNKSISAIELALENSSIYAIMDSDSNYTGEKIPEKYKEEKLQRLKEGNEGNFNKLENLLEENPSSLFQMYAELPYYKSMLFQYGEEDQMKLLEACDYFEQYMVYKFLGKPITSYPTIDIDPEDIDYNQIHNLLSHFALIPTVFNENEVENYKGLSDADILERYGVSGILGQDILFECAKLLDYDGKNSIDDLKLFFNESDKGVNGIYFNGKHWVINEKTWSDDKFAGDGDSELNKLENIEKMRNRVNANVNSSWNGSMFEERGDVNKEIGNKILKIIDDYIALRKGDTITQGIENYVKVHSNGKYISLPTDLIIKGRKAGKEGVGLHLYKYENGKLVQSN